MSLKNLNPKFDIEKMFEEYLQRGELDKAKMHPIQLIETRTAFYMGVAQMLFCFTNDFTELKESEIVGAVTGMQEQIHNFIQECVKNYDSHA